MIISRTPFRVSFFGGGTDYPAWYTRHGGAVLATTIDKYCYISVRELPPLFEHRYRLVYSVSENVKEIREINHPAVRAVLESMHVTKSLEIHHDGDLPARAGLGSSSAFTVGLVQAMHALEGRTLSKPALADAALHIEQQVIREPVGSQDQICAAFGGFNHVAFNQDGSYRVAPLTVDPARLDELQVHLVLVFTGISRIAAEVAETQIRNVGQRVAELTAMRALVDQAAAILTSTSTDIAEFGRLLHDGWMLKRRMSDRVSSPTIDALYERTRKAGAIGGKLLGAGGGGFLLLFVRPEDRPAVREALGDLSIVRFRFESGGSQLVLCQPDAL